MIFTITVFTSLCHNLALVFTWRVFTSLCHDFAPYLRKIYYKKEKEKLCMIYLFIIYFYCPKKVNKKIYDRTAMLGVTNILDLYHTLILTSGFFFSPF